MKHKIFSPGSSGSSTFWILPKQYYLDALFKTAIFSRFLKVAIARSTFMNKVDNWEFAPEFTFHCIYV